MSGVLGIARTTLLRQHRKTFLAVAINAGRTIARLLWVCPALLLFLTLNQAKVALDLRTTWERGIPATAEVTAFENSNRADITYGYVSLRIPLGDDTVLTKEQMSLPNSLLPRLEGKEHVDVRVRPGRAQEVVIDALMPAHWLIAASQAGISLLGMLILATGVFWWNRYLQKKGDPARRSHEEEAPVS